MFGWLRRRKGDIPVEQTDAFQVRAQRAVEGMTADLEAFMDARFDPSFNRYLGVLRDRFEAAFDCPDAPPIIIARIEYKIFLENIDDLRSKMLSEISAMSEWRDILDEVGMGVHFKKLVDHRVHNFMMNLKTAGLQIFLDSADRLREADDRWRAANPGKAAEFPVDT
jgi:hypothetical protein